MSDVPVGPDGPSPQGKHYPIFAEGSFGQLPVQPCSKEGCGCGTVLRSPCSGGDEVSFIRPRHRQGWLSLWDVSQGRAGSHHGTLVKAEKATTALLSALPVLQPPRAAGLLLPKEGSGFVVLLPQQDQLLPVSQEGASPADQALPSCSAPQLPPPGTVLAPALLTIWRLLWTLPSSRSQQR